MGFYVIGLGLGDAKDITVRGLEVVKRAKRVYLEAYTAILSSHLDVKPLEEFYEREVILATRTLVEQQSDTIFAGADQDDIAFLVVGDPLAATTHHDLITRAQDLNIKTHVIHNASIMNAVAACGLYLYNFGKTISIPFFDEKWRPTSFYEHIVTNWTNNMHTLCLLDIKVREQSRENIVKGVEIYEPPRYMTINQAIEQLYEAEAEYNGGICTPTSWVIGLARVGQEDQIVYSGTAEELLKIDFGGPLHSLVIPSPKLSSFEDTMIYRTHWDVENRKNRLAQYLAAQEEAMLAEFRARKAAERELERINLEKLAKRRQQQKARPLTLSQRMRLAQSAATNPEASSSEDTDSDTEESSSEDNEEEEEEEEEKEEPRSNK